MKKGIILVAAVSLLLVSCGGSRWSCKKRYCDVNKTKTETSCLHVLTMDSMYSGRKYTAAKVY